jgi:hypothetical protein
MIGYVHHHLGIAIAWQSAILHAIDALSHKPLKGSGTLRVSLFEIPYDLFRRQGSLLERNG